MYQYLYQYLYQNLSTTLQSQWMIPRWLGHKSKHRRQSMVIIIMMVIVMISFAPLMSWASNIGRYSVIDAYGEASGFLFSYPRQHMKKLRHEIMEKNKVIARLQHEIKSGGGGGLGGDAGMNSKIQSRSRKLIEDYLELQAKMQTLEDVASQSQSILKKKDTFAVNEVSRLNSTYVKIFAEMKKKLTSLQTELAQQVEVSEKLENEVQISDKSCEKKVSQATTTLSEENAKLKAQLREASEKYKQLQASSQKIMQALEASKVKVQQTQPQPQRATKPVVAVKPVVATPVKKAVVKPEVEDENELDEFADENDGDDEEDEEEEDDDDEEEEEIAIPGRNA